MLSNVLGAAVRALLVMMLIATPGLMLPPDADMVQMTVLVSLFAGGLILVEYAAVYPGFIAFRDAAPFNRLRFVALFTTVFSLCAILQQLGAGDNSLGAVLVAVGRASALLFEAPFSPSTMMADALAPHVGLDTARAMSGWAMVWAFGCMAVFLTVLQVMRWPMAGGDLNLWVNLPLFYSAEGAEVVERLRHSAGVNFLLGGTIPFVVPFLVMEVAPALWFSKSGSEQMVVWLVTLWAVVPLACWMRGIACLRIADGIATRQRDAGARCVAS